MGGEFRNGQADQTFISSPRRDRVIWGQNARVWRARRRLGRHRLRRHRRRWPCGSAMKGQSLDVDVELPAHHPRGHPVRLGFGVLGVAAGAVAKNQVGAIVVTLAWLMIVGRSSSRASTTVGRWFPVKPPRLRRIPADGLLTMSAGGITLGAWLVGLLTLGTLRLTRRYRPSDPRRSRTYHAGAGRSPSSDGHAAGRTRRGRSPCPHVISACPSTAGSRSRSGSRARHPRLGRHPRQHRGTRRRPPRRRHAQPELLVGRLTWGGSGDQPLRISPPEGTMSACPTTSSSPAIPSRTVGCLIWSASRSARTGSSSRCRTLAAHERRLLPSCCRLAHRTRNRQADRDPRLHPARGRDRSGPRPAEGEPVPVRPHVCPRGREAIFWQTAARPNRPSPRDDAEVAGGGHPAYWNRNSPRSRSSSTSANAMRGGSPASRRARARPRWRSATTGSNLTDVSSPSSNARISMTSRPVSSTAGCVSAHRTRFCPKGGRRRRGPVWTVPVGIRPARGPRRRSPNARRASPMSRSSSPRPASSRRWTYRFLAAAARDRRRRGRARARRRPRSGRAAPATATTTKESVPGPSAPVSGLRSRPAAARGARGLGGYLPGPAGT